MFHSEQAMVLITVSSSNQDQQFLPD